MLNKATFAIVNPQAGNGRTRKAWPRLHDLLIAHFEEIDWQWTQAPGHATSLARNALQKGCKRIISIGGDGTHSEVANALLGPRGPLYPHAALAPLSSGTGSDFSRSLAIPKEYESAIAILAQGRTAAVDVGWLIFRDPDGREKQRGFLNIMSLGMGGEVDLRVNQTTKAMGGFVSFLWGTLTTLFSYRSKRVRFALDGGPWHEQKLLLMAVANGQYFGGGMWMAPKASLDSGVLDIIVVEDMSRLERLARLPRLYRGTHLTLSKVSFHCAKRLSAQSYEEVWLDVDGEPLGTLPIEVSVLPKALRVFVGPDFQQS